MTISSFQNHLTQKLTDFLAGKALSENTLKAYTYDLTQFMETLSGPIDETSLRLYAHQIEGQKPSVQRRKRSAVNQFLRFLYQEGDLASFFVLPEKRISQVVASKPLSVETTELYQGPDGLGKLACLLILDLGLLPVEVLTVSRSAIDLNFSVVSVTKGETKRVLKLTQALTSLLSVVLETSEEELVFSHHGKAYSRQWLHKQLQAYLSLCGLPDLTAQGLRQQFILNEIAKGTGAFELAQLLGLKSPVTLEKYYRT